MFSLRLSFLGRRRCGPPRLPRRPRCESCALAGDWRGRRPCRSVRLRPCLGGGGFLFIEFRFGFCLCLRRRQSGGEPFERCLAGPSACRRRRRQHGLLQRLGDFVHGDRRRFAGLGGRACVTMFFVRRISGFWALTSSAWGCGVGCFTSGMSGRRISMRGSRLRPASSRRAPPPSSWRAAAPVSRNAPGRHRCRGYSLREKRDAAAHLAAGEFAAPARRYQRPP